MVLIRSGSRRARSRCGLFMRALLGVAALFPAVSGAAADTPAFSGAGPRDAALRFDSLLKSGTPEARAAARGLTAGPARRLFPLLVETQARLAPFLDTAKSRDSILAEAVAGDWAVLTVESEAVFTRPVLGLSRLTARQAVHLNRGATGWRLVDFEEIAEGAAAPSPRTGPFSGDEAGDDSLAARALLPVSPRAPRDGALARATRLRLRIAQHGGDSLPVSPGGTQTIVSRGASWAVIETARAPLPDSALPTSWHDSLAVYRASTPELDLTDKLLRTRAAQLKQGSPHDVETARRVWRHVSESFDYKLGATLFATSREALRDLKGDCSEAAVLTAALLRAAGIPSRVVMGYATLSGGVWIGHAWTEAFIGGAWVGVDAALREFPAGPARLALVTLSGERPMKPEATNLMIRTLANLDIEILGAWAGREALPLVEHPGAADEAARFWDQVMEGAEGR